MQVLDVPSLPHPSGEAKPSPVVIPAERVTLQTPQGPVTVSWSSDTATSTHGLAVFFIEFLFKTGLWQALCDACPLRRTSPNAPSTATVVGSLLLTVLSGGNRYRHGDHIRGDQVLPELLGMQRILSPDAMRRAVQEMATQGDAGQTWLVNLLQASLSPIIRQGPWILDVDSTVVTVYGHQEGSAVGYNPTKRGRPSYSYHSFLIGGLRLVLEVDARPGNESHGAHGSQALWQLLDKQLPPEAQPWCLRGDISYGNEAIMQGCEARNCDYLFKLRQTAGVKALITSTDQLPVSWSDAGAGWEGREERLQLITWTSPRRIILLRRKPSNPAIPHRIAQQASLFVAELCPDDGYEYAVLVTSLKHALPTVAQFYRDRADCENVFADLKNDWGWGGFTTTNQQRNQLMARFVVLVYNWWNIFVRRFSPQAHREGHVSRPLLLHGVARRVRHAGQTILRVTSLHAQADAIRHALTSMTTWLNNTLQSTATQLTNGKPWDAIIAAIFAPCCSHGPGPPTKQALAN